MYFKHLFCTHTDNTNDLCILFFFLPASAKFPIRMYRHIADTTILISSYINKPTQYKCTDTESANTHTNYVARIVILQLTHTRAVSKTKMADQNEANPLKMAANETSANPSQNRNLEKIIFAHSRTYAENPCEYIKKYFCENFAQ